jgi:FtsP/CotA-like multicopper oxidase with cupredoxin domain
MSPIHDLPLSRRHLLTALAAGTASLAMPRLMSNPARAAGRNDFSLRAAPGRARLVPEPHGETPAWCYNGNVPGPELRVRQGERLRVTVENALAEETTVHWHGLRVPNAMDGVPHLTQRPIGAGETFLYEFDAVDAGTFWYHPHQRSFEQVGRGLYGPLIIEEAEPPRVDREVTWVLDDWRLTQSAEISEDFGNRHDMSHGGRVGNTATINGRVPDEFAVRRGERVRLRLINAANARIFGLDFRGHAPRVIALDGQPVTPHEPPGGLVVLGPAMRADLILDMTGEPQSRVQVIDRFYQGLEYRLIDLAYDGTTLRDTAPDWSMALPANPQRRADDPPRMAGHRPDGAAGESRDRLRRRQSRRLDVPLPHSRTPSWRHDGRHSRRLTPKPKEKNNAQDRHRHTDCDCSGCRRLSYRWHRRRGRRGDPLQEPAMRLLRKLR